MHLLYLGKDVPWPSNAARPRGFAVMHGRLPRLAALPCALLCGVGFVCARDTSDGVPPQAYLPNCAAKILQRLKNTAIDRVWRSYSRPKPESRLLVRTSSTDLY